MRPIRSILVPVRKYSARSLPIVNKAAQLAAALSAKLELFHDMADPIMLEELGRPGYALRSVKADIRRRSRVWNGWRSRCVHAG